MKQGWTKQSLGDLCEVVGGGTPSKDNSAFYSGKIPWATVRDMRQDVITETECRITKEAVQSSATNIIPAGNVVIATRVGLGKVCLLGQDTAINQDLRGIIPRDAKTLSVRFLFWWLKTMADTIIAEGTGATVQGVKLPFVKSLQIPVPPLAEQQRIVGVLDEAFAGLATAQAHAAQNLQNAQDLFKSCLNTAFNQGAAEMKKGWKTKCVGDILQLEYGKPLDESDRKPDGRYPVYGANGEKDRTDMFYHDRPSIIVGRKGSAGEINLTEQKFWPLDVTYFVTFDESQHDLRFLYYLLTTLELTKLAKGVKPGINRNEVYSQATKVPPLAEQQRIVEELDALAGETERLTQLYEQKLAQLSALKKSLLHQAFTGELTHRKVAV